MFTIQDIAAGLLIAVAVVYLAYRGGKALARKRVSGCGGCGSCAAKDDSRQLVDLVASAEQLKRNE